MGSLSASTAVKTLNLGTCAMKDEDKPRLCEEEDGLSCERFTKRMGMVILQKVCGWCVCEWLFCKISAVDLSDLQHKHLRMSPSKDLGMLHLCRAIANACVKQRVGHKHVFVLSTMLFSHAYGAGQGLCHCVKPFLRQNENRPSHMHMIITICTSNVFSVWGLPKESASVLCASIFLLLWMRNNRVGTNDDAV